MLISVHPYSKHFIPESGFVNFVPISCPSLKRNLATCDYPSLPLLTSLWDTLTACHPATLPLHLARPIPLTLLPFAKVLALLTLSSQWNIIVTVLDGGQNCKSIFLQTCRRILTHFHTDSKSQNLASRFRSTLCVWFESFSVYHLDRFKHFSHLFFSTSTVAKRVNFSPLCYSKLPVSHDFSSRLSQIFFLSVLFCSSPNTPPFLISAPPVCRQGPLEVINVISAILGSITWITVIRRLFFYSPAHRKAQLNRVEAACHSTCYDRLHGCRLRSSGEWWLSHMSRLCFRSPTVQIES